MATVPGRKVSYRVTQTVIGGVLGNGIKLRFWSVEGIRRVSNVLRAMEHAESQPGEEVPRRQVASDRTDLKACLPLQELAYVLQLRNMVLTVATVFDQLRPIVQVLGNGMLQVKFVQLSQDCSPSLYFFVLVGGRR